MTPRLIWIPLAVLLTGLALPPRVAAQGPGPGRVLESMEITDRRIEIAERLVAEAQSSPAASEVEIARQLQGRARSAFSAAQYGMAERATLEARTHADRAIAIVRGLPDPDRVQIQVERTAELADRARERLSDCTETRARALLRVGFEMQSRAEAAVRESRYLAALQLTTSARERIQKAMRLCNVAESLGENASRALQRTDEVIARTRELLDEDQAPLEAKRALARAVSLQSEAQAEFRAGHHEPALRLTHSARLLANRALRASGPRGRAPRDGR